MFLLISYRPSRIFLEEVIVVDETHETDPALLEHRTVDVDPVALVVIVLEVVIIAMITVIVIVVPHLVEALAMMIMTVVVILLARHLVVVGPPSMTIHHHVVVASMILTAAATTHQLIHTPTVIADLVTIALHHETTLHETLDTPTMNAVAVTGNYFSRITPPFSPTYFDRLHTRIRHDTFSMIHGGH
jgi:hypothetical protein